MQGSSEFTVVITVQTVLKYKHYLKFICKMVGGCRSCKVGMGKQLSIGL
jgi:hypothetical protein